MHQADIMAARYENERWLKQTGTVLPKAINGRPSKKVKLERIKMETKLDFNKIFNE
jgi:hypothetical protein